MNGSDAHDSNITRLAHVVQVKHARAVDAWKDDADAAVAKFNEAGCAKGDIVRALVNHSSEAWKTEEDAMKTVG